jgi:hypothetical protein
VATGFSIQRHSMPRRRRPNGLLAPGCPIYPKRPGDSGRNAVARVRGGVGKTTLARTWRGRGSIGVPTTPSGGSTPRRTGACLAEGGAGDAGSVGRGP